MVKLNAKGNGLSLGSVISSLSYNTYNLAFGTAFDIMYIPNITYVYKAGNNLFNNVSISKTSENISDLLLFFLDSQLVKDLTKLSMQLTYAAIQIPAARKIATPLFYYFGNFDDLYLYSLHKREYGDTMNSLFSYISGLEANKWSILSFQSLC